MADVVLVPCVARTGSSAVARVLEERFGIDMGGPGLVRPENPDGVYEREWMAEIDKRLLVGRVSVVEWAKLVRANLDELDPPFGMKHPMNTAHFAYYLVLFPDAVIVRVTRDMDAVVDSWCRVYNVSKGMAAKGVLKSIRQLDNALRGVDHKTIDMTERRTDDEIVTELDGYRGLEAL